MTIIRRARPKDARGIHDAHMRSIQELCSKDHSPDEIRAWGGRPYQEDKRVNDIANHLVWVVDADKSIEGYGLLTVYEKDGVIQASIGALYLTPDVSGSGFGKQIVSLMLSEAKARGVNKITLRSTLTAHDFYKRMGFRDSGALVLTQIAGVGIRSFPMELIL